MTYNIRYEIQIHVYNLPTFLSMVNTHKPSYFHTFLPPPKKKKNQKKSPKWKKINIYTLWNIIKCISETCFFFQVPFRDFVQNVHISLIHVHCMNNFVSCLNLAIMNLYLNNYWLVFQLPSNDRYAGDNSSLLIFTDKMCFSFTSISAFNIQIEMTSHPIVNNLHR